MDDLVFDHRLAESLAEASPARAFAKLAILDLQASGEQRELIRHRWDFDREWDLPDVTTLACRLGTEESPEDRIRLCLAFVSIGWNRCNYQRTQILMCRVYHSCRFAGLRPNRLFAEYAALSSPDGMELLIEFAERPLQLKGLEMFDLEAIESPRGTRIEMGWGHTRL